jgi:6-phosphogluconolactonase
MIPFSRIRRSILGATTAVAIFSVTAPVAAAPVTVYVGTYTGQESKGLYAFDFDPGKGEATSARLVAEIASPSFLALHPNGNFLYAVNETSEINGEKGGGLSAFKIGTNHDLTALNTKSTKGDGPCHLFVDQKGRNILAANYGGGSVISYQLEPDGRLGAPGSFIQHQGSSVNAQRQEGPHAHGVYLDRANRLALVPDLGLDKVMIYDFDAANAGLKPANQPFAAVKPGSGPRHLAIHPNGKLVFVLSEMASTVTTFSFDSKTGTMKDLTTVSTLPKSFEGNSSTAEIFVHPNGRFVYASNRGDDSIAAFSVDESTGRLTSIQRQSTGGKTPRNFNIDPSGNWLLAANQESGTISIFKVDPQSGKLTMTGQQINVPTPVCLVFSPAK